MNLIYKILPIYLLLDICISSINNLDTSHIGNYLRHYEPWPLRGSSYQHYDSYSSQEIVMRESPRRSRSRKNYNRRLDYSNSQYNYKCKCSCIKCKKRKPKQKTCCEEFCATECAVQNSIVVVPYPVPFIVFNQSATDYPPPTTQSTTTTTTAEPTTTTPEPTRITERITITPTTLSTVPYYDLKPYYKRFRIMGEKNMRRNNMAKNSLRSPNFGRLPKYGIVPIPEKLALSLMQQIKKDQNNGQLRKRLALDKNLLDYTRRGFA